MKLSFWKYEGLGNDFVVVEGLDAIDAEQAQRLCDRHRGIGADGVLLVEDDRMKVINADGSVPQMCGNGLRCVVQHLKPAIGAELIIDTDAGPHRCIRHKDGTIEIAMRPATFDDEGLLAQPASPTGAASAEAIDAEVEVSGRPLKLSAVSMGNPHAVLFGEFSEAERLVLGPAVQAMALFPEGANVGFATPIDGGFELHVYERGAGWTQACGTGACAAAAAAVRTGRAKAEQELCLRLPGGDLRIRTGAFAEGAMAITMRGPATMVFEGQVSL